MGEKEDLVRRRLAREAAERATKEAAKERQRKEQQAADYAQFRKTVEQESARIAALFENADWEYAEIASFRTTKLVVTFWLRLLKSVTTFDDYAMLEVLRLHARNRDDQITRVFLRSDGKLFLRGSWDWESYDGYKELSHQDIFDSLFPEEQEAIIRALRRCVRPELTIV